MQIKILNLFNCLYEKINYLKIIKIILSSVFPLIFLYLLFNSQFKKFLIGFKKNIILNNKIQDILKIIYNLNTSEYFIMIHPLIGYLISIFV